MFEVPGLLRSQMKISDSVAPDARQLGWHELKSKALTALLGFLLSSNRVWLDLSLLPFISLDAS